MRCAVTHFLVGAALAAQGQSTFYAAWEDGREAERQGQWRAALAHYQRAAALRPTSAARVVIYGNNLLYDYYPQTRVARCHVELGDPEAAETALQRAEGQGEPGREREELARRVRDLRAARAPKEAPAPRAPETAPRPPEPPSVAPVPVPAPAPPSVAPPRPEPAKPMLSQAPPPSASRPLPSASPLPVQVPLAAPTIPTPAPSSSRPARWPWIAAFLGATGGYFLWRRLRAGGRAPQVHGFKEPERVGPYRVEGLLGRGGFASTYLARHERSGKQVALKLLHPYRQEDPEFTRRFRQEARLGSLLDHPNLVKLVDPGPPEGPPWLAMAYVAGERLDHVLRSRGPLPLAEALHLAKGIASAMAHAHAHGVVHRDLKPGNVMLEDGHVKVMDFGIARIVDAETLTTTYAFLGTPLYAAPEAQLKTQVGPAADRYALGVMLFEMLAGHPPFKGETPFEILDQHRGSPLPDLAASRPDVPPVLLDLIARLCRKDPADRPDEVEVLEVLEVLEPSGGA